VRGVSDVGYAHVGVNRSTGGWFGIFGGTHEKDCVLCMLRLTNSLGVTLQDCNRVMEHTRFLLLTRSTSAEGCCSRIERKARKIAECTSYTPCVLLSFSLLCVPPKFHNLPSRGNIPDMPMLRKLYAWNHLDKSVRNGHWHDVAPKMRSNNT